MKALTRTEVHLIASTEVMAGHYAKKIKDSGIMPSIEELEKIISLNWDHITKEIVLCADTALKMQ